MHRLAFARRSRLPFAVMALLAPAAAAAAPQPPDPLASRSDEFDDPAVFSAWTPLHDVEGVPAPYSELDVSASNEGRLTIVPTTSGWFNDYRGPFFYKEVTGDFLVETRVEAQNIDDPTAPPTKQYNAAGIEVRDPTGTVGSERWMTHNIGYQAAFVGSEGKQTRNSRSQLRLVPGSHKGRLRICRVGNVFILTRWLEGESGWSQPEYLGPDELEPARYTRGDLPATVQVGLMVNGWNSNVPTPDFSQDPDVRAVFDYVRFATITSEAECLAPLDPLDRFDDDFDADTGQWDVLNGSQTSLAYDDGQLVLEPDGRTVWYGDFRGPHLSALVSGDFKVTAAVAVESLLGEPVTPDFRQAGILMRNPDLSGLVDSYHVGFGSVAASQTHDVMAQWKSTDDSASTLASVPNPSGAGELRLCRVGETVVSAFRPDTTSPWTLLDSRARPDFPRELAVGPMVYNYERRADLRATFDHIDFASIDRLEECLDGAALPASFAPAGLGARADEAEGADVIEDLACAVSPRAGSPAALAMLIVLLGLRRRRR